jgi:hypothetical protein
MVVPLAPAHAAPVATTLSGANEVPGPGDPDGTGTFTGKIKPGRGLLCYTLTVSDIAPATAAHVHVGTADVAGPVVIGLTAPTAGSSSACLTADRELLKAIAGDPEAYYVNVHNADYPAGAVRGQLG